MDRPLKVIVFGATGGTGRELLRVCVDRGFQTTAFVHRSPVPGAFADRVEVRTGDVRQATDVEAAIAGHDAVLVALGATPGHTKRVLSDGTAQIVRAMQITGARRLVVETGANLTEDRSLVPRLWRIGAALPPMRSLFQDKARQEAVVRSSGLEWVLVRPVSLTDGPATGSCHIAGSEPLAVSAKVSRADVAAFMVEQLTSDKWLGQAVVVDGPGTH